MSRKRRPAHYDLGGARREPPSPSRWPTPLTDLKERAAQELFRRIGTRLNDPSLTEEKLHALAREELAEIVEPSSSP